MAIRQANQEELKLINQTIPTVFKEAITTDFDLTDHAMRTASENLRVQGAEYYVLTEEGKLKGFVLIDDKIDYFIQEAYGFIYELYVFDEYRRHGVAEELLHFVSEHYKEKDVKEVRLNVFANNFAKKLYEKMGFRDRNITMSMEITD
ncbi:MAG TPA: GNAT family N-acetyltransferase [Staphylococcus sp.]|nr:GNAT family N-acetyltransferase [Staphylococcus sp.]